MCFSASAGFIAGTALPAVGVAALRKTEARSERPFALIPLLFGIQQLTEGVIWLTFRHDAPLLKQTMTNTATSVSCFFSSHGFVKLFGVLALLSFIAAYLVHAATLVSVWCFFAAILSLLIYLHLRFRHPGGFPGNLG